MVRVFFGEPDFSPHLFASCGIFHCVLGPEKMSRIRGLGNLKIFCLLCVHYWFCFLLFLFLKEKKTFASKINKSIKLIKRTCQTKEIVRKSKIISCVVTHSGFFQMKLFPVHWQILSEQCCFVEGCDSASSPYFIAS